MRAITPPRTDAEAWSTTDELLAIVAERVGALNVLTIRAWSATPPSSLPDVRIPRPYDDVASSSAPSSSSAHPEQHHRRRRPATKEELRRFMGKRIRYTPRED